MATAEPHRSPEEIARLGTEVFDRHVRPASEARTTTSSSRQISTPATTNSTKTIMRRSCVLRPTPVGRDLARTDRPAGGVSDEVGSMMHGMVNARLEAIVALRVRGPTGAELNVDAIVTWGFTAALTLPSAIVSTAGPCPAVGRRGRASRRLDAAIRHLRRGDRLGRQLEAVAGFGRGQ